MSFLTPNGHDTNDRAVHNFNWARAHTEPDAADLKAVQPWVTTTELNGNTAFFVPELFALYGDCAIFDEDLRNLSILGNTPEIAHVFETLARMIAGMDKVAKTRPEMVTAAKKLREGFDAGGLDVITLNAARTEARPTQGTPAWQLEYTFGCLVDAGVGAEGFV